MGHLLAGIPPRQPRGGGSQMPPGHRQVSWSQQQGDEEPPSGFGLPTAIQPAPTGRLEIGTDDEAFRGTPGGEVRYDPIGRIGHVQQPDVVEAGSRPQVRANSLVDEHGCQNASSC